MLNKEWFDFEYNIGVLEVLEKFIKVLERLIWR